MNIIFGRDRAAALSERYIVLELDTIRVGAGGPELTAFCVIETMPILDMPKVESMKKLHENLMVEYRKRNWNYCLQALEHLTGFWGNELDTFYENLNQRVSAYLEQEPETSWDGVVEKELS